MYYSDKAKHYVAVDCIIFGFDMQDLKLLCIKRNFEPEMHKWSLMGGFLKEGESIDTAAERVLHDLTGLKDIYLEQLQTYGELDRDPAGRVLSVAYYALINPIKFEKQLSKKFNASWFRFDELPELVFDHREMVEKALKRLRRRCRYQPLGFELLPEKFTIPQLQNLYEEIFMKEFDKRNFRKKIMSFDILVNTEEKDKEGSRKGAYLYKFDEEKYARMIEYGFNFEI